MRVTFATGDLVGGRYQVKRFVARGGMGEVYEADDPLLEERVALKTLVSTALNDERAAYRFKREARLTREVTHENVCRVLEFGVHTYDRPGAPATSLPFLTMEFLEGETLTRRLERHGPFTPGEALPLVRQILAGLAAIHEAGIVHRDLKSDNVFLATSPRSPEVAAAAGDRVVVMDFGLARALDGNVVTTWPRTKVARGSIDFMAPEQIEGGKVDLASDQFALGVLLFQLLAGRRPFVDVPPVRRLAERAPALSSVVPHADRRWEAVIARCLQLRPEARFPGLAELRRALDPEAAPARAEPPPRPRLRRWFSTWKSRWID